MELGIGFHNFRGTVIWKMRIGSVFIVFAMIFSTGCATLFGPSTHKLAVSSEPAEADVFVNGMRMGVTPVVLDLKADQAYTIEYRKIGYDRVTRVVNTRVGAGWVILDVLGGLIPVIIDASTGAWNNLE